MRAGDTVLHKPSGEKLSVAYVEDGRLVPRGWPLTYADAADCELIKSCSDDEHVECLTGMSNMQDRSDPRCRRARLALGMQV